MPATRLERILAAVGIAATLALAAMTAVAWANYADAETDTGTVTAPTTRSVGTTTATEPAETRTVETRATETRESEPEPPPSNVANLVLTAARGDCWLQVRAGSAGGELLYIGILEQTSTRRFTSERLWLELGAPSNLDATVNGEPLEFPDEPTTAVVTPEGLA